MEQNQKIRSTCHLCFHSCGVLVNMEIGKPISVEGDPDNPMTKGKLCPKGLAFLEYLNHPDRLKFPLKRIGEKGKGNWKEIPWDEALEIVAKKLTQIKERFGALSLIFIRGAAKGLYGWDESNINIVTSDKPPYNREMGSTNLRGICCKVYKDIDIPYYSFNKLNNLQVN